MSEIANSIFEKVIIIKDKTEKHEQILSNINQKLDFLLSLFSQQEEKKEDEQLKAMEKVVSATGQNVEELKQKADFKSSYSDL